MTTPPRSPEFYRRAQRRIGWLTLALGLPAGAAAALLHSPPMGAGVAAGAVLAWVNYRWLEQGATALSALARAQQSGEKPRISGWVWARVAGRYALLGAVAYAIVAGFAVPALGVLLGLLALGAAAMAESLYEVCTGTR